MSNKAASNGHEKQTRDHLLAITLGGKQQFKRKDIEYEGGRFYVKQLSVGERGDLAKKIRGDDGRTSDPKVTIPWACIFCVYNADDDAKVFEPEQLDDLMGKPSGTFVDIFGNAALQLNGLVEAVDTVGNSDATADDSQS